MNRLVTFAHPFRLPGMDADHVAGTFTVNVEEEQLDVVWDARRTTTTILLPAGAAIEAWPVSADDLNAALKADADIG